MSVSNDAERSVRCSWHGQLEVVTVFGEAVPRSNR